MNEGGEAETPVPVPDPDAPEAEPIIYHYSRARRLDRAPPSVRWLASQYGSKGPGFFRRLTATKSSKLMLLTIVALALAFNVAPIFSGPRNSGRLGDERYSVKAFYFEGRTLALIKREGPVNRGEGLSAVRSIHVKASSTGGETTSFEFPVGASASEDFRIALESSRTKSSRLTIEIEAESGRLKLETTID